MGVLTLLGDVMRCCVLRAPWEGARFGPRVLADRLSLSGSQACLGRGAAAEAPGSAAAEKHAIAVRQARLLTLHQSVLPLRRARPGAGRGRGVPGGPAGPGGERADPPAPRGGALA
jgi:hypothetical protein